MAINITDEHINNFIDRKASNVDYSQILARLANMKCRLLQTFGDSNGGYTCTHILAATSQGQEFMMLTPPVPCEELISCTKTEAQLVPMAIRDYFQKNFFIQGVRVGFGKDDRPEKTSNSGEKKGEKDTPVQQGAHTPAGVAGSSMCFLSHMGIDAMGHPSGNCSFDGTERTMQKMGKGMKFYQALALVKYEELVSDTERDNLQTFVGNARQTKLFRQMIEETGLFELLNSDGPYTIFAPSDTTIISKYGKNYEALKVKGGDYEKSFVLSHIIPGTYQKDFSGSVLNLNGDEVVLEKGKIENVTIILDSKCKYNGNVCIMKHVVEPKHVRKYEGRAPSRTVSMMDISHITYRLWQIQNSYDKIALESIESQLEIMTKKLSEFRANIEKMEKVGDDILKADARYRDIIHEHDTTQKLDTAGINARLGALLQQYNRHMEASARIIAAEQLMALITKLIRDA